MNTLAYSPAHAAVVLDIAGTSLNAADRKRLKNPLTGGLILFATGKTGPS